MCLAPGFCTILTRTVLCKSSNLHSIISLRGCCETFDDSHSSWTCIRGPCPHFSLSFPIASLGRSTLQAFNPTRRSHPDFSPWHSSSPLHGRRDSGSVLRHLHLPTLPRIHEIRVRSGIMKRVIPIESALVLKEWWKAITMACFSLTLSHSFSLSLLLSFSPPAALCHHPLVPSFLASFCERGPQESKRGRREESGV